MVLNFECFAGRLVNTPSQLSHMKFRSVYTKFGPKGGSVKM